MAVLPWGHTQNQTTGDTEKAKASSLDWFSRNTAEPSRQAINSLMKQHSRAGSGGSVPVNLRGLSGSTTPTSPKSQHRSTKSIESRSRQSHHRSAKSTESRSSSAAGVSSERPKASHSRPSTPSRPSTSGLERSDSTSKSLFQKGGLLRRKGSKMGLTLNSSPTSGVVSPSRPNSSRAGLRGKDVATSPTIDESRKPSISKPFDFTHVMHGDSNMFTGLGRIDESDLASQFDAIQARYRKTTDLPGRLDTPPQISLSSPIANLTEEVTTALPQMTPVDRSSTPPPEPPPKDSPSRAHSPVDIRTSRSTENFSRPTPRSPISPSNTSHIRPASCHLQGLKSSATNNDESESAAIKPLPQLPTVIHAVSTQDDTARLMISAPLPTPPLPSEKNNASRHQRQSSSRSSLRHMSTFPSSKHAQNGILPQNGQLAGIREEDGLVRPHSDYELTQRNDRRNSFKRASMNKKPLQVEDWEEAIDSAWDYEDDMDAASYVQPNASSRNASPTQTRESYLTIEQPPPDFVSSPSTPLMTMAPTGRASRSRHSAERSSSVAESGDCDSSDNRSKSALFGLGIENETGITAPARMSRAPRPDTAVSDTSRPNASPRLTRSAYSAISHSSSQESIILSIASSIMSTQRSSISSFSVSDYAHFGKTDRSSVAASLNSPLLNVQTQKAARPESTCLPSTVLQPTNPDAQKAARPDSNCLPAAISSKRDSIKSNRPESTCLPHEMLDTFPVPETTSKGGAKRASKASGPESVSHADKPNNSPTGGARARTFSSSRVSASSRASTTSASDGISGTRQRSNTQSSRNRPSRVSYSLFPSAQPASNAIANGKPDSVTS